jgi:hypothetical protein
MYKPNGEEPMSKQEELRRREDLASRAEERARMEPNAGSLRSAFYSAMFHAQSAQEGGVLVGDSR